MVPQATLKNVSKSPKMGVKSDLPTLPTLLEVIEIIGSKKLPTYLPTLPTYL